MKKGTNNVLTTVISIIMLYIFLPIPIQFVTVNIIGEYFPGNFDTVSLATQITVDICLILIFIRLYKGRYILVKSPPLEYIKEWRYILAAAIGMVILGLIIDLICVKIFPVEAVEKYAEKYNDIMNGIPALVVVTGIITGPIVEEIMFRGIMYRSLRIRFGYIASAIISSGIWGIAHFNILQFTTSFAIGMLWALIMEKYNKLWLPIILHMINNAIAFLAPKDMLSFMNLESTKGIVITAGMFIASVILITIFAKHPVMNNSNNSEKNNGIIAVSIAVRK